MEWISVEERLPETIREVFICYQYSSVPIQSFYNRATKTWYGSYEVRDYMQDVITNDPELINQSDITHWGELPEPPKNQ